jgi:acyl-CoA synthetase (AMP-forming)/AMP-acid ligase II
MNVLDSFSHDDVIITQDDLKITKSFFEKYSDYIASLIDDKFPFNSVIGVKSDNNALGLALIIGVIKSGRNALPLSSFNDGPVNDYLISNTSCEAFIGYGTEIDHSIIVDFKDVDYKNTVYGGVIGASSGSTGIPKITLSTPVYESSNDVLKSRDMVISRIGDEYKKVFYSPPMMSGCMVYFYMWLYGISIYCTNQRPSTELINKIVSENNIKMISLRPTMIDRLISEGVNSMSGAEVIVTSGAPITDSQIEYCSRLLGIKHILDFYATTEAGVIAVRDAIAEKDFELFPEIQIKSYTENGVVFDNKQIMGFWDDKNFKQTNIRFVDDVIEYADNKIKLLGRKSKKIKVSGFSVPSELVRQSVLKVSGVRDCKVFAEGDKNSSDILTLEYTGHNLTSGEILNAISNDLPFYCIPKKIQYVPQDYWGLTK